VSNRVCSAHGCPELYPKTEGPRCATHRREHHRARGTKAQRGYGSEHTKLRTSWSSRVATGTVKCARCNRTIAPAAPWALDHADDRETYLGPSHKRCNDSAGGTKAHAHPT